MARPTTSPAASARKGSRRSRASSNAGGTLVTMGNAVRFPIELGMARTVERRANPSANFYAPRPLVKAEVLRLDHPVFYGYSDKHHADQVSRRPAAVGR